MWWFLYEYWDVLYPSCCTLGLISRFASRLERWDKKSVSVTQLISNKMVAPNASGPLLQAIKEILNRDWNVSLHHVNRKASHSADFLANLASSLPLGLHVQDSPPIVLNFWLQHYMYGVSSIRSILPWPLLSAPLVPIYIEQILVKVHGSTWL